MKRFLFTAAFCALAAAAGASAATYGVAAQMARDEQELALHRLQADNAAIRLELDAMRRELMRRPVPPPNGPVAPHPDAIPQQNLPVTPKE